MSTGLSPRGGIDAKNEYCDQPILDYSFKGMLLTDDVLDEEPRVAKNSKSLEKNAEGKVNTQTVKLNNNQLSEMAGLDVTFEKIVESPEEMTWLDLSFNDFSKIDPLLLQYTKLKVLYLHGNNISNLSEVDKLAGLPNLIALTLHGNPLEDQKGYRQSLVAKLPQLKKIDFSSITKSDRQNAVTWERVYGKRKPPKKPKDDE
ncbi:leucine-rich repeat-containing protein 51-like [Patiria miniata]|uniref:Leucine-rich repeat-containing protein 51 n=1 Tax=Patiria miniata TaxID=46514 RepID=A0A913ZUT6_PATMI|nr:leucine-rich repeat-containing protein 51-like [Patiria miniata]XP_038055234.1 leucine-rich repeat-containing protein 51-like [Patiria miniata]